MTDLQQIVDFLYPGAHTIGLQMVKERLELRADAVADTIEVRRKDEPWRVLFTREEVEDGSYKACFRPRLFELYAAQVKETAAG